MSAYVSIRQRTGWLRFCSSLYMEIATAYVSLRRMKDCDCTSAYVSIRQHTSAYVSIRQHTSAYDWMTAILRMILYGKSPLCLPGAQARSLKEQWTGTCLGRHKIPFVPPRSSSNSVYLLYWHKSTQFTCCVHKSTQFTC
jgi:hypothetical protein